MHVHIRKRYLVSALWAAEQRNEAKENREDLLNRPSKTTHVSKRGRSRDFFCESKGEHQKQHPELSLSQTGIGIRFHILSRNDKQSQPFFQIPLKVLELYIQTQQRPELKWRLRKSSAKTVYWNQRKNVCLSSKASERCLKRKSK